MNTPVLFIIFNRPETTLEVFNAIRKAQPKQLFVAADGPRKDRQGEAELCMKTREIATSVDWNCEVKTLFRDENLGCGLGPADAISWFFKNVDQGIILEDDCLPSPSFFQFCEELLEKYKYDEDVYLISGTNPLQDFKTPSSYIFSRYAGIWGWASWKRAWQNYDYLMSSWSNPANRLKIKEYFANSDSAEYFFDSFEKTYQGLNVSWWDYQWLYCRIINNSIGIVPKSNLIKNIGFGANASHTFDTESALAKLTAREVIWPLNHPEKKIDEQYDVINYKLFYKQNKSFSTTVKSKLKGIINKIKKSNQ